MLYKKAINKQELCIFITRVCGPLKIYCICDENFDYVCDPSGKKVAHPCTNTSVNTMCKNLK